MSMTIEDAVKELHRNTPCPHDATMDVGVGALTTCEDCGGTFRTGSLGKLRQSSERYTAAVQLLADRALAAASGQGTFARATHYEWTCPCGHANQISNKEFAVGSVFTCDECNKQEAASEPPTPAPGMSLRDHFAGLAMQGELAFHADEYPSSYRMQLAKQAYAIANAMLAAREAGQ